MKTLADAFSPQHTHGNSLARDAMLILGGSLFVAICAKVQFPTLPVAMTLQPFAVLLVGAVLGGRRGALALIAYLLEGAAGLPVFAQPMAGPGYFAGPSAGYLFAFPIAAGVVGHLCELGWDRRFWTAAAAMSIGQAIILLFGFLWLAPGLGAQGALVSGVIQYLPGDVLKIAAAAAALPTAWRLAARA